MTFETATGDPGGLLGSLVGHGARGPSVLTGSLRRAYGERCAYMKMSASNVGEEMRPIKRVRCDEECTDAGLMNPKTSPSDELGSDSDSEVGREFSSKMVALQAWFATLGTERRIDVYRNLLESQPLEPADVVERAKEAAQVEKLVKAKARVDFIKLLPKDTAFKILRYVDPAGILAAESVSRAWYKVAHDDRLWKRLCWQHINKKCKHCGLGMPMTAVPLGNGANEMQWKTVFRDRLALELNWRKGRVTITEIYSSDAPVTCLSTNNRMIISGHADGRAHVFCTRTLKLCKTIEMHSGAVTCMALDQRRILSGSTDGTVKIWCQSSFNHVRTIQCASEGGVSTVGMSAKYLVAGGADGTITVWSFDTGGVFTLTGHTGAITGLSIHGCGLMSASEDASIRTWYLSKQLPLACVTNGHTEAITGMSTTKDMIATCSRDKTIKFWSTENTGEVVLVNTAFGNESSVQSLQMNNLRVLSGAEDNSIKVFDKSDGRMLYALARHTSPVDCISARDSYIVSGDRAGNIIYWNFATDMTAVLQDTPEKHAECIPILRPPDCE